MRTVAREPRQRAIEERPQLAGSIHLPTSESQKICVLRPWLLREIRSGGGGCGKLEPYLDRRPAELSGGQRCGGANI
jgi:hypothetical protein